MNLYPIETGKFKLDGGAMFGVVPKSIWQKTNPADENNMCGWSLRCLLVENGNQLILIDTGIGDKQTEKFFSHYYLHGNETLKNSIEKAGFSMDDITDVILTHLHFDHCGGAIARNAENQFRPVFKNATYWSSERHWKWATEPNARERASFLKENIFPIEESGQLKFANRQSDYTKGFLPDMDLLFVDGHTDSMMLPVLHYKGKQIIFMADLLPSVGHIPLPYVMGYDTRPLITLEEKGKFLQKAADEKMILFFEHDYENECCTLINTDKGVRMDQSFLLKEIL
ncbi:MAG: MBL fold metallo-hydrolase [Crocinitomicaceae bacterium]|nr:MBL fold metallo-hydrolase [Crocinitomicaceae bacterium]